MQLTHVGRSSENAFSSRDLLCEDDHLNEAEMTVAQCSLAEDEREAVSTGILEGARRSLSQVIERKCPCSDVGRALSLL